MFIAPRIKKIYPVYQIANNIFRIGAQIGITSQIKDVDNKMKSLVDLMDGRPLGTIVEKMLSKYPALVKEDIIKAIKRLDQAGFVEESGDIQQIKPRYRSNVYYFSRYLNDFNKSINIQRKINQSNILLLGLGGGGANILTLLAGLGPKKLKIVDFDRVELSNLGRQFLYKESDIGKLKVEVAKNTLQQMNSDIEVEAFNLKISTYHDLAPLLSDIDLAICVIDEPQFIIHRIVNKAMVEYDIPFVFGASQVSRGRVYSVIPHVTGCFDCLNIHYMKQDDQFIQQFIGLRDSSKPIPTIAYGPSIFQLTAAITDEAMRLLTGYAQPMSLNKQFEINYETGASFTHQPWGRYPKECPTCGKGKEENWEIFSNYQQEVSAKNDKRT